MIIVPNVLRPKHLFLLIVKAAEMQPLPYVIHQRSAFYKQIKVSQKQKTYTPADYLINYIFLKS